MENTSSFGKVKGAALKLLLAMMLATGLMSALSFAHVETAVAEDTATAFATRLYTVILDRNPDAPGLEAQVNALKGGYPPAEIAYNYFNSEEYFNKHWDNQTTVEKCYRVMFGRDCHDGEEAGWVKMMDDGMSVRAVIQGFSQSQEYRNYFGSVGMSAVAITMLDSNADKAWNNGEQVYSGPNYRDQNQGASAFVKRMYEIVLGRVDAFEVENGMDVAGFNVQANALANGMPCWQIAFNFFDSQEFKNHGYSNYEAVAIAYEAILGRTGTTEEIQWWVDEKEASCYSVTDVVLHFCNSDEFNNNVCAPYGLVSGMRGPTAAALPTPHAHTPYLQGNVCTCCGYVIPEVGDIITFGAYEQDGDLEDGADAIEWRVVAIEDGKALLMAEYGLDVVPYNTTHDAVTWETSSLRQWMNNDFLTTAFNDKQLARIVATTNENPNNPDYDTLGGATTVDRVFTLSYGEVWDLFNGNEERVCIPTTYAISKGAVPSLTYGTSDWWLRTPGINAASASVVYDSGRPDFNGMDVDDEIIVVRPFVWITL